MSQKKQCTFTIICRAQQVQHQNIISWIHRKQQISLKHFLTACKTSHQKLHTLYWNNLEKRAKLSYSVSHKLLQPVWSHMHKNISFKTFQNSGAKKSSWGKVPRCTGHLDFVWLLVVHSPHRRKLTFELGLSGWALPLARRARSLGCLYLNRLVLTGSGMSLVNTAHVIARLWFLGANMFYSVWVRFSTFDQGSCDVSWLALW